MESSESSRFVCVLGFLWRGSLLPLGSEAVPIWATRYFNPLVSPWFTTAAQPSGSKLPRHNVRYGGGFDV
ncbi:hypothetical protein FCH79_20675 [Pseudomonas koreensis]|nr:hypothetical protein [Pseudomonas koreensis]